MSKYQERLIWLAVEGGAYATWGKVVGQLAVHDDPNSVTATRVSHILTGGLIAAFTNHRSAIDFAEKVGQVMDFDTFALCIVDNGLEDTEVLYAEQLKGIKELKASYSSYIPFAQLSLGAMTQADIEAWIQ